MRISRGTANPALVRLAVDYAADTLHWLLDNVLELLPDHPVIHHGHETYSVPRTYWGPEEERSVLKVIAPMVERAAAAGAIDLRSETRCGHCPSVRAAAGSQRSRLPPAPARSPRARWC